MNSLYGFQMRLISLFKKIKIILIQFIFIFLIFNQQSLTEADEINDLEIEGMSIGESALKYYSKNEIQSNKKNWYKSNKYSSSEIGNIQITYKEKMTETKKRKKRSLSYNSEQPEQQNKQQIMS